MTTVDDPRKADTPTRATYKFTRVSGAGDTVGAPECRESRASGTVTESESVKREHHRRHALMARPPVAPRWEIETEEIVRTSRSIVSFHRHRAEKNSITRVPFPRRSRATLEFRSCRK